MVADAQGLDPALLAAGQRAEEAELDELGLGAMLMELAPQCVVGDVGVPQDGAGVAKRSLFPFGVALGSLELEQIRVVLFREALPFSLDGPLYPSVVAFDGLRHVDPAQLLDVMVEDPVEKRCAPCLGKCVKHSGHMGADRLALRTRCGMGLSVFDDRPVCGVQVIEDVWRFTLQGAVNEDTVSPR